MDMEKDIIIYKVQHHGLDLCNNSWEEGKPTYWEAVNAQDIWLKLGRPTADWYMLDDKRIDRHRTPEGKGTGYYEDNPEFDWRKDLAYIEAFGSCFLTITPIEIRR